MLRVSLSLRWHLGSVVRVSTSDACRGYAPNQALHSSVMTPGLLSPRDAVTLATTILNLLNTYTPPP
jgi:hypothetical protein